MTVTVGRWSIIYQPYIYFNKWLWHRDDAEKESGEMGLRFVFCFQHGQGPVMAHCFSVSMYSWACIFMDFFCFMKR